MALAAADASWMGRFRQAVADLLDALAASRMASGAAILIVAAVCFLPGLNTIPPIDRDDARFAEITREMIAAGDFADVRIYGEGLGVRPPGLHWLQALAAGPAGSDAPIWLYRLPSALAGIAAALLTWWMALAFGRPRAALLAGLFIAASVVLAAEARLARPDAALLATVVLAEGALARLWLGADDGQPRHLMAALFWAALGAGILVKGPIAPIVIGATIAVLAARRRGVGWLKCLEPVWGVPLLILILLAWVLAVVMRDPTLPRALADPFAAVGSITPLAPPGSYTLLSFAILWPASSFLLLALPWIAERIRQPAILFGVAWALPFWLFAEAWPEKLPHYVLPALPALALLAGHAIDRGRIEIAGRVSRILSFATPFFAIALALGTPLVVVLSGSAFPYAAMPALLVSLAAAFLAWRWLADGATLAAAGLSVVAAVLMYFGSYAFVVPKVDRVHLTGRVLADVAKAADCDAPAILSTGYSEPSLLFLAPGTVRFDDAGAAADFLAEPGCRVAIVEARRLSSFRQRAEDLGLALTANGNVSGINLGVGRRVSLRVFTAARQAP